MTVRRLVQQILHINLTQLSQHQPLGRRFLTTSLLAADASLPSTSSSTSFASWIPDAPCRLTVPLTTPLPHVTPETPYLPSAQYPETITTTLRNGVRIVTEATPGPTASLGIYVNSGSIYEEPQHTGSTALLECLAFKTSKHRSTLQIMKEVDKVGSNIIANGSREQMAYTIDCLKTLVPSALELLCDSVLNPAFLEAEVEEQKARLLMLLSNREIHATLMGELIVRAAYDGGYGKPLIPDAAHLPALSARSLQEFWQRQFIGSHIVLAAAGVDHDTLVQLATPMLEHVSPGGGAIPEPESQYRGGFALLPPQPQDLVPAGAQGYVPPPAANIMLGFEVAGGWRNVHGAVVMTVLNYLLGGGSSFSSGGPGKGMHSRLYTRVLNQYYWVQSCMGFNNVFNNSGLMGISGVCEPARAHDMLNVMVTQLESITRGVNQVEVERAKRAAISVICNALESKATSAEDIGRQMLTYGHRVSGATYREMIQAITPQDVSAFVGSMLTGKPSLVTYGQGIEGLERSPLLKRFNGW